MSLLLSKDSFIWVTASPCICCSTHSPGRVSGNLKDWIRPQVDPVKSMRRSQDRATLDRVRVCRSISLSKVEFEIYGKYSDQSKCIAWAISSCRVVGYLLDGLVRPHRVGDELQMLLLLWLLLPCPTALLLLLPLVFLLG